ncbi:MAG: cyclic nucleotide-binding domain-containing protein [Magnetococcales bacterium]|nr:cyclic nucleotide-binding domain-containing protein [Magnetococcales bacterium]
MFFKKESDPIKVLLSKQQQALGRVFKRGEMIIREGDVDNSMYVIQSGAVEVFRLDHKGQEMIFTTLEKGDVFGEMSLFDSAPRSASIRASSKETRVLCLTKKTLLQRIREDPFLMLLIFRKMSERIREKDEELMTLTIKMNRLMDELPPSAPKES